MPLMAHIRPTPSIPSATLMRLTTTTISPTVGAWDASTTSMAGTILTSQATGTTLGMLTDGTGDGVHRGTMTVCGAGLIMPHGLGRMVGPEAIGDGITRDSGAGGAQSLYGQAIMARVTIPLRTPIATLGSVLRAMNLLEDRRAPTPIFDHREHLKMAMEFRTTATLAALAPITLIGTITLVHILHNSPSPATLHLAVVAPRLVAVAPSAVAHLEEETVVEAVEVTAALVVADKQPKTVGILYGKML